MDKSVIKWRICVLVSGKDVDEAFYSRKVLGIIIQTALLLIQTTPYKRTRTSASLTTLEPYYHTSFSFATLAAPH